MTIFKSKLIIISLFTLSISPYLQAVAGEQPVRVESVKNVYDGDTFRAFFPGHTKDFPIRVKGVDTPEIRGQCVSEKEAAIAARDFTRAYLSSAKEILLTEVGKDRYDRVLAVVWVDGVDLANVLIDNGLGREWRGRREQWCE
ncbi:thermonuclease family protein [Shewanella sp. UCD-KL12]|uniref:thermonuclease family protein n=1 Tax=Shewanella sp. UCD-KL12 TaxID=1917163 RepID=UPI000970C62E|nr:thermonuclease family protein [Shewanella sp. UCD-KL12]